MKLTMRVALLAILLSLVLLTIAGLGLPFLTGTLNSSRTISPRRYWTTPPCGSMAGSMS